MDTKKSIKEALLQEIHICSKTFEGGSKAIYYKPLLHKFCIISRSGTAESKRYTKDIEEAAKIYDYPETNLY
jgi:hypothetical protein